MMLDEPYRFAEAVSNRRDYIEDQLRGGSPVVGLTYADGILLLTLGRGQQKIYETYDRIAMGSVGHPTDIEKLRQAAVDLASVVGFNYSDADVTLQQIVHFGLGPAVKASFDDIIRSPYISRILLAELDGDNGSVFYTVDYDGSFATQGAVAVVGGSSGADAAMLAMAEFATDRASLNDALQMALKVWAAGWHISQQVEVSETSSTVAEDDVRSTLSSALEDLAVEAVILDRTRNTKSKYLALSADVTQPAVDAITG